MDQERERQLKSALGRIIHPKHRDQFDEAYALVTKLAEYDFAVTLALLAVISKKRQPRAKTGDTYWADIDAKNAAVREAIKELGIKPIPCHPRARGVFEGRRWPAKTSDEIQNYLTKEEGPEVSLSRVKLVMRLTLKDWEEI
jgi:hypothetical protein